VGIRFSASAIGVIAGVTATLWTGSAAAAADAELDQLMSLSLLELINIPVITASRQVETRDQTPAHILVFTREQIRERRYRNLADLLEDLPGVDFMRGTKSSAYNNFAMQGYAGPNKLLVLLDGVRIGNPAGGNFPVAENFSLYLAKQVEILYGPAAALYGADAVAGVVNIITDRSDRAATGQVSVGAGAFGSRETAFLASTGVAGPLSLSVGGHWQQSDRAPLNEFYPGDFPARDARSFAGTVMVPAAAREDYTGSIRSHSLYARADLGSDLTIGYYRNLFRSLTSTGDRPETALYLEDAPWITRTDTVYGKYRFQLNPRLSGELVVDYSLQQVDPRSKYVNIYTGFQDGYEYTRGERLGLEQNLTWQLDERHRVQAGLGYQRYHAIEAHTLPSPYDTDQGPDSQGLFYRNTDLPLRIHDASYDNVSAYAQLQSQWSESLSTMAGLRLDHHSAYGQSVNPRLGAVWRANSRHLFKVLYGEAFRAPSPDESLSSFGAFDGSTDASGRYRGTGFRVPNFALEPEKARTLGMVWDWRPRQDMNLVTNVYRSQIRNLVVTLPSSAVNAIPGAVLINPESKGNAGEQSQYGIDLMAQWRFRIGADWTGEVWGSASWIRGQIDEGDGVDWDLSFIASHKVKLGTTLRWQDRFSITPQVLWIGDTTNGRKDTRNVPARLETPGYALTNLHLGWHKLFEGRVTLWLDIYNLFDKRYYAAHGAGSRTFFNMPQQPRSWMASVEYRF
jgi:outer membrane receptor protein involved in Fe transport